MNNLKQVFLNLFIPLSLMLVFALVLYYEQKIPSFLFSLVPYLFYMISLIVLWVSWHFNRNRFLFVITPLLLIYVGFEYMSAQHASALFHYSSLLFPLHLLLFLILKERGLFSSWGLLKVVFLALEVALVLYLIYFKPQMLQPFLDLKIFAINFYPLKDIAVAVGLFVLFVMASMVLFGKLLMYNTTFFMILISFYGGFYLLKTPNALELSFLLIGIMIFTLLIRETYRLAFYDELTSMPGRRALIEDMAKLSKHYALAMIDIDFFKKFNDTYGHDTGDEVLKMVASKLSSVGGGAKAYRYGGEEFTILFPSKSADEAFLYVDTIRATIANTPFSVRNKKKIKKIFVNISAGLVQNTPKDKNPFAVMKRADNALYKAKESGRNKVVKA